MGEIGTIILFWGIILFIWYLFNQNSSNSKSYYSNSNNYSTPSNPISIPVVSSPSNNISANPTKISSSPEKKISLIDGEYRYFQNYNVNGIQYTFGFPKGNCPDQRVWVGIDNDEIERISYSEAMRRINSKNLISNTVKQISSSNSSKKSNVGFCSNCGKKLRGNVYKSHCTECWNKGYR